MLRVPFLPTALIGGEDESWTHDRPGSGAGGVRRALLSAPAAPHVTWEERNTQHAIRMTSPPADLEQEDLYPSAPI